MAAGESSDKARPRTLMPQKIHFKDHPEFQPNLTPEQIFRLGAFGGTYWRPITSGVAKKRLSDQHLEFKEWWEGIPESHLTSPSCNTKINRYKKKSGSSLKEWESKGWIVEQDPYGWVQWYCRFFKGRRSPDDERQIQRWMSFAGPKGRFRNRLINMCRQKGKSFDDYSVSPVIRQGLLHWAYELTQEDFDAYPAKS